MRKCLNERVKNILNAFLLNERTDQKTESTALKKENSLTQATMWMNLGGAKGSKPIKKAKYRMIPLMCGTPKSTFMETEAKDSC